MKKFIALALALVSLLFSFAPAMKAAETNVGIEVCEDIWPDSNMHD